MNLERKVKEIVNSSNQN